MMNYKQYFLYVTAGMVIIMVLFCSCKKFIEIEPSANLITDAAVFSNDQTALSAVNGVYIQMRNQTTHFTNGGLSFFTSLSADEIYNTAASATYDPFIKNELLSTTSTISGSYWTQAYRLLYRTNAILEGLTASLSLSDTLKMQLTGEMKLTRALVYFYLVNLFGDVPLVLTSDYSVNAVMPRTPVPQVYEQIVSDLKDAQQSLRTTYPVNGKVRPNRYAASALLARVYLYLKDWEKAEVQTALVINSSTYTLLSNLNNVFLKNSGETIWEIASSNDAANTAQGGTFIPSSATSRPTFAATSSLLNSFEPNDQRRVNWLKANIVSGITYYYPFKYKTRSGATVFENLIVLRLSEQYLLRAEARAERNDLSGALADLNVIRNRAGLGNMITGTKEQILDAIRKERITELFTEWGDRWLDLKRTGQANAILSSVKGATWQETDQLYPLPQTELDINVFLIQNPGYN